MRSSSDCPAKGRTFGGQKNRLESLVKMKGVDRAASGARDLCGCSFPRLEGPCTWALLTLS